jgi:RNA recognition motif-containing protein
MTVETAPIGNYHYHSMNDYLAPTIVSSNPPGIKMSSDTPHSVPVKLFVGRFPLTMNDAELQTFFEPFGKVHECVILRDIATKASKGL